MRVGTDGHRQEQDGRDKHPMERERVAPGLLRYWDGIYLRLHRALQGASQ
jgi:hypothetical protein